MAIFNEIIIFEQSKRSFSKLHGQALNTSGTGIETCVGNYLHELSTNYGALLYRISNCTFRLIFHGARDLYSGNWQAEQKYLKKKINHNSKDEDEDIYPIIHLTTFDIFEHTIPSLIPKRYKKIIDSSIWNYYVPLEVAERDENNNIKKDTQGNEIWNYSDNFDLFVKVLEDISKNSCQNSSSVNLYDLSIAHENADLNARLCEQSYLQGSHQPISPFLFHSEQEMRNKIDDFENENEHKVSIDTIREYRWRFLLLDDKSGERMSGTTPDEKIDICKLQIVANNLHLLGFSENQIWFRAPDFQSLRDLDPSKSNRLLDDNQKIFDHRNGKGDIIEPDMKFIGRVKNGRFIPNETKFSVDNEYPDKPDDIQIVIDCVKHVDAAQYCLQTYKYEIVLLDYLLDKDKVSREREYGYHLLRELHDWHAKKKNRTKKGNPDEILDSIYQPGPNGRFFFMFISAYTTAVHERLLAEGFPKAENGLWFIGDGACPTNTPNLFAYQLLLLMRNRIKDLSRASEGNFLTLIDLLKEIFVDETERDTLTDIRERAHDHFNHLLFMRDKYKQLENDMLEDEEKTVKTGKDIMNMHGSLLVQSAFKRVHHFSGSMFEHLQHLVYLTAFGTIRQWTELWEEYVFIHKTLLQYDTLTGSTDGLRINKAIRNYIIQLKENSN